jgi:predicted DNA-binding transcriptional regulator AlpA
MLAMDSPDTPTQRLDPKPGDVDRRTFGQVRNPQAIVQIDPRPKPGEKLADLGPLLDTDKAAERISRSRSWVYQAWPRGDFVRPIYIGRQAFFPERWVDAWIAAQVRAQLEPGPAPEVAA